MNTFIQKTPVLAVLLFVFSILLSCSKDTDLLMASVLNEDEVAIEENDTTIDEPAEQEGFEVRNFTFSPVNDAYLQDDKGFDQSIIRLEENRRTSYLMFDLSQINGPIKEVTLEFSVEADAGDGNISIFKGSSTDWTEEDLTKNNAPKADSQLGAINKEYALGSSEKVALNAAKIKPELTTLILLHQTGDDLALASKEHPQQKGPKLIIKYEAPEGSEEINQEEEEIPQEEETPEEEETPQTNDDERSVPDGYFVTVNGQSSNDGKSEATAWSIDHAFSTAMAGDIVYIKAGNYGGQKLNVDNSGTSNNPIKFIGYTNTPGDIISDKGSTFKIGNQLDADKMPLISLENGEYGLRILERHITIENFQLTRYRVGVQASGDNLVLRNIVAVDLGSQSNYDAYDGFGFQISGNNSLLENCFVLNATAEAIKLTGADYSRINYSHVYADNPSNPTDYYFFLTGGIKNAVVENCHAERAQGLNHGGHGFDMKDRAEFNTFQNCTAIRTNIELNFSGVKNNTIKDCSIYGVDTTHANWHAGIVVFNGANNNLFTNIYIQDTYRAIAWADDDDRYVGPGGDRDETSTGYDNTFDRITIKNTDRIVNVGGGNNFNAWAKRNTFTNCDFTDFNTVAITYYPSEDIVFKNCRFNDGRRLVIEVQDQYANYSDFDVSWQDCTWTNVDFTPPNND